MSSGYQSYEVLRKGHDPQRQGDKKVKHVALGLSKRLEALQSSIDNSSSADDWRKLKRDAKAGKRPFVTEQHLQHLRKMLKLHETSRDMKEGWPTDLCRHQWPLGKKPLKKSSYVAVWNHDSKCLQIEHATDEDIYKYEDATGKVIRNKYDTINKYKDTIDKVTMIGLTNDHIEDFDKLVELNQRVLKVLNFHNCVDLVSLPDSIGQLINLQTLGLSGSKWPEPHYNAIESLPDSIGECKSLTSIDLSDCKSLVSLPDSIGDLKSLTFLNLSYCKSFVKLPDSIGKCESLTSLDLSGDEDAPVALTSLPDSIGDLKALTKLNMFYCENVTTLPDSIGDLTSLTELNLNSCYRLESLPERLKELNLTNVNFGYCQELDLEVIFDVIFKFDGLTKLSLAGLEKMQSLPVNIGNLTSLTKLDLSHSWGLATLPESIGDLESLTKLDLCECGNLTSLPESIGNLTSLTKLYLRHCNRLASLPKRFGNLTSLTELDLSFCTLVSLPKSFEKLTSLKELDFVETPALENMPEALERHFVVVTTTNVLYEKWINQKPCPAWVKKADEEMAKRLLKLYVEEEIDQSVEKKFDLSVKMKIDQSAVEEWMKVLQEDLFVEKYVEDEYALKELLTLVKKSNYNFERAVNEFIDNESDQSIEKTTNALYVEWINQKPCPAWVKKADEEVAKLFLEQYVVEECDQSVEEYMKAFQEDLSGRP